MKSFRNIRATGFLWTALAVTACTSTAEFSVTEPESYQTWIIDSDALGEERQMRVALPEGHDPERNYPIVFVTDAGANFALVSEYLAYSSNRWPRLPEMVVIGIDNVDRNRDFIPRPDPRFPGTGQAERFLDFVESELLPEAAASWSKDGPTILFGHSFGGTNAIHFALERPDVFDAHIAVGSSTWIADRVLFEIAETAFQTPTATSTWLYMSVAEADGGLTVPDGIAFSELLEEKAPATLDWRFEIIPETTHFNALPPSLHNAFEQLFPVWTQRDTLRSAIASGGEGSVDQWFQNQEETLGYRFIPQAWDLMVEAYTLANSGQNDAALRVLERLHEELPDNSTLPMARGDILAGMDRNEDAMIAYSVAREIAVREGQHANEIETIERRIKAFN